KGTYILKFLVPSTSTDGPSLIRIVSKDTRWVLLDKGTMDTVAVSDTTLSFLSEQLVFHRETGKFLGISISINQVANPGADVEVNNGIIGAGISAETSNPRNTYIGFLPDYDAVAELNWILSGTGDNLQAGGIADGAYDKSQSFERLSFNGGGSMVPYNLTSHSKNGPSYKSPSV